MAAFCDNLSAVCLFLRALLCLFSLLLSPFSLSPFLPFSPFLTLSHPFSLPQDLFPSYVLKVSTLVNELKDHILPSCSKNLRNVTSRSRCMVTCYPPGGKYTKHVDNGGGTSNGRRLTCLFYLNEDWKEGDGGELVVYERGGKVVKDKVQPVADRLVLFWSDDRVPHEVLEAKADRFTVTIWFFDTEEWEEAKRLGIIPKPAPVEGGGEAERDAEGEEGRGAEREKEKEQETEAEKEAVKAKPKLAFADKDDDAAREPESKGVGPMVCTNEPFVPAGQAPALFSPATSSPSSLPEPTEPTAPAPAPAPAPATSLPSMTHLFSKTPTSLILTVTLPSSNPSILPLTNLDVSSSTLVVSNPSCDPAVLTCDLGEEVDAAGVKAKFSKKKCQLKVTVARK